MLPAHCARPPAAPFLLFLSRPPAAHCPPPPLPQLPSVFPLLSTLPVGLRTECPLASRWHCLCAPSSLSFSLSSSHLQSQSGPSPLASGSHTSACIRVLRRACYNRDFWACPRRHLHFQLVPRCYPSSRLPPKHTHPEAEEAHCWPPRKGAVLVGQEPP